MNGPTPGQRPRTRHLLAMTRSELDTLPGKSSAVVIVPTGSIEQHGPHLPVGVDSMLGQGWLAAALPLLPADAPVYVGPPVTYGKSNEHLAFPGTLTLSARTLHRLILAIARQVHALGFRTLALLNTHGGNSAVLNATLREVQNTIGINACLLAPTWKPPVATRELRHGIHAGRIETAWMLALAPHLVHMERAVREFPVPEGDPGEIGPVDARALAGWMSQDVSHTGTMGDATAATAGDGRAWIEAGARSLADRILELLAAS